MTRNSTTSFVVPLRELQNCFEGAIPAVIATVGADGIPNVTFLSRVRMVDDERVALSNQFFSKTTRNLAENPKASLLIVDPTTYRQYRLALVFERTDRRSQVFELLRGDVAAVAASQRMEGIFKLLGADIYRVASIDVTPNTIPDNSESTISIEHSTRDVVRGLAEISSRLSRCFDLDTLVATTVDGLDELFGYRNNLVLLLDEEGSHLYTIASRGFECQGVGSEIPVGEGIIGMCAARCATIRLGNLRQLHRYGGTVRRGFEDRGDLASAREIFVPGLPGAQSRVAAPAMARGELVGVLVVESGEPVAFGPEDEYVLSTVAALVAGSIDNDRSVRQDPIDPAPRTPSTPQVKSDARTLVRYFEVDGSVFIDGDYLIKGVAGRLLRSLLHHLQADGRVIFTNRELRLDPSLELPPFRDNFESRLVLLKRRLDERQAPLRIERIGRGQFRVIVDVEFLVEDIPVVE